MWLTRELTEWGFKSKLLSMGFTKEEKKQEKKSENLTNSKLLALKIKYFVHVVTHDLN